MKKSLKAALALVLALVMVLCTACGDTKAPVGGDSVGTPDVPQTVDTITIASANSGGAWYTIAGALADLFQNNIDGVTSTATSGAGISNIFSVSANEAQLGFGFPDDVLDAKNGVGDFAGNALNNVVGVTAPVSWCTAYRSGRQLWHHHHRGSGGQDHLHADQGQRRLQDDVEGAGCLRHHRVRRNHELCGLL